MLLQLFSEYRDMGLSRRNFGSRVIQLLFFLLEDFLSAFIFTPQPFQSRVQQFAFVF